MKYIISLCCGIVWISAIMQPGAAVGQTNHLTVVDSRNTPSHPSNYNLALRASFKHATAIGLPIEGSSYYTLFGLRGWYDDTGGAAHELAFSDNNGIFYRSGGDAGGWASWRKIISENASGHVGIGTSSPQARLHVNGGGISVSGANSNSGVNGFQNFIQLMNPDHAAIIYNAGLPTQLMLGFHSNGNMYWGTNNNYTMHLSKTGHLRVYTSLSVGDDLKSGTTMSVKGKIAATEVEVTNSNWPDYVFEEDYVLPSLYDTERFIKKNKHLPDVPSAKDVEDRGIALGEMNAILLKKLEELTLHLIEKNKQIQVLDQRLTEVEAKSVSK